MSVIVSFLPRQSLFPRCLAAALLLFPGQGYAQAPGDTAPRIAIWNPEKGAGHPRIELDEALPGETAETLRSAGMQPELLTTAQLGDPTHFSTERFDALMLEGTVYPAAAINQIQVFADQGGVIVALNSLVPFLIQAKQNDTGYWQPEPAEPRFAWQRFDILKSFGLAYSHSPERHNLGVEHTPTGLWLKYLPDASVVGKTLPSHWVTPGDGAKFYALMRARRADLHDALPSLYIARTAKRSMIVCNSPVYTRQAEPQLWPHSRDTVVALARLAADLRHGRVKLSDDLLVAVEKNFVAPEPLRERRPTGSVDPEGAAPLARWGLFDGSSLELGPVLAAGKTARLEAGAPPAELPRGLAAGARVELALPASAATARGAVYLRVRGAYTATGAALRASLGGRLLHSEQFTFLNGVDAGGSTGVPAQFMRACFIPVDLEPGAVLTLENPGKEALHFDAVQLETRPAPMPEMLIGLGSGYDPSVLPPGIGKDWGAVRTSVRTNFLGAPNAPGRWSRIHAQIEQVAAINGKLHLIAEGTPPWAAISQERLEEAQRANRAHTVIPDTGKLAVELAELATRYRGRVQYWEIWNEPDIQQFWRGTPAEYVEFFKAVAPAIRAADPQAKLISGGLAAYNEKFVDSVIEAGIMDAVDVVGFHPYASKTAAWDVPYGRMQAHLYARGVGKEIYCDESGFVFKNSEWFTPPPQYTPAVQRDLLNVAMARLLANGLAKLNVFHAGGQDHPYGLIQNDGKPRPAYEVFADYTALGLKGGRRLDVSLVQAGSEPLEGVYAAAAAHEDGSVTVVLNPAESKALQAPSAEDMSTDFNDLTGWTTFFGKTQARDGLATVTPDPDRDYAGFYTHVPLNPARTPMLEFSVPECEGTWSLLLKLPDGTSATLASGEAAGQFSYDLREHLPADAAAHDPVEISFRFAGKAVLDYLRFPAPAGGPAAEPAVPVKLRFPLAREAAYTGQARSGTVSAPVELTRHTLANGQPWAEADIPLRGRTVLTFAPAP